MLIFQLFIVIFLIISTRGDDIYYTINNKKILHKVSDKFLSISIDPAVLLAGVNLSDTSLTLAKNLSPAFIRLAGPSTPFVKYIDNEDEANALKAKGDTLYVTPAMWFGINEWFNLANLTPVFGIDDGDKEKGVWNPSSTMPLLEMSDELGITCYWQLGFGCLNNTAIEYIESLNILRQTLKSFPAHNGTWKIVAGDFSTCNSDDVALDSYVRDLDKNSDAVMWESSLISKGKLGLSKAAVWTSVPKETRPVTFASAMEWALKVGEAARLEYDVIFREPRLMEITKDTPVYWFSFLHKKLMGSIVLDIKSSLQPPSLTTYAHCTKRQNNFVRSGAVTLMVVNNGSEVNNVNIRLGKILLEKSMEVQSYYLTSSNDTKSKVFLNDEELSMNLLQTAENLLKPKLRRAKVRMYITLEVPAQTIAFFVLTGAKNDLCANSEEDLNSVLEEINLDQDVSLTQEETVFNIQGRLKKSEKLGGEKVTLETIKKNLLKEMEQDKSYYNGIMKKDGRSALEKSTYDKKEILHKHLKAFVDKSKKHEAKHKGNANLHLTIQEIEDILKRRAKSKAAARNIKLTSSELDMLVDKATLKIPKHFIAKRDINRMLLEEKADFYKNNIFDQEMFEQNAKKRLFKIRSSKHGNRVRRSINKKLLDLKAQMEEHKKYMAHKSGLLKKASPKRLRLTRDINLGLLKKRTESNVRNKLFGRSKIAFQPNWKHEVFDKGNTKYDTLNLDGSSEELFGDLTAFDESSSKDTYNILDSHELEKIEEAFIKSLKNSQTKSTYLKPSFDFDSIRSPKSKSKVSKANSDRYLQFLRSASEEDDFQNDDLCFDGYGFGGMPKSEKKMLNLWKVKSSRNGNGYRGSSICSDFNFSDEHNYYGFLRKKRDTDAVAKNKLRNIKKDFRNEMKKLRQQMKEDKMKYLIEKIKNKVQLKQQKHANRTHIQIVQKSNIIPKADSKENEIDPHNMQKRSFINNDVFGNYKSITSELKSWKPSDILKLHNNYFRTLPVYSWVKDPSFMGKNGLRKKRYIAENLDNLERNEISDEAGHQGEPKRSEWMYEKGIIDVPVTANIKKETDKNVTVVSADKWIFDEKESYLEKILGKQKAKSIENFFQDVKNNYNSMTQKMKDFFKNMF